MRAFRLPIDHCDVDLPEACLAEHIIELHFGEAEPEISIHLPGVLKLVRQQYAPAPEAPPA